MNIFAVYVIPQSIALIVILSLSLVARADELPTTKTGFDYCIPKGGVSEDGVIVRFGSRYIHTCQDPFQEPGLKRMLLLNINAIIRIEHLGITAFRVIRLDERFTYDSSLTSHTRNYTQTGQVTFGETQYDRFDTEARTHTGGPSASVFVYEKGANSSHTDLPRHYLTCKFPSTPDKPTTFCGLRVGYKGIQLSVLAFQGGDLFIQTPFETIPSVVEDMVRLMKFADVTDKRADWPPHIPVFD